MLPWLEAAYTAAKAFRSDWVNYGTTAKVWYKFKESVRGNTLTLAFTTNAPEASGWTQANAEQFETASNNKEITNLLIYLGTEYQELDTDKSLTMQADFSGSIAGVPNKVVSTLETLAAKPGFSTQEYTDKQAAQDLQDLIDAAEVDMNAADQQIKTLTEQINGYIVGKDGAKSTQVTYKEAVTTTANTEATAKTAYEKAQAEYDKASANASADALKAYQKITLTGDVTANDIISEYAGVINGNGHIINLGTAPAVFEMFKGTLSNAGVNGKFATAQSGAAYSSVTYWANNEGSYYNENGAKTENITTLGELGFVARKSFGVDFDANKLIALTNASKVYGITVYGPNSTTKYYAKKADNGYVTASGPLTIAPNQFVKSETSDLTGANIFYSDGTCPEVVITDKADFFCPVDILAAKVTYKRNFNVGKNAICLPFDLTKSMSDHIEFICTYEKEDVDHFWFTKRAGAIAANTPALISAKEAFTEIVLGSTTIKATPALQLCYDKGDLEDESEACGLLKKANNEEIKGASNSYKVFGLTKEGTFKRVPDGTEFAALRMVVYSHEAYKAQARAAAGYAPLDEKAIGILEENGTNAIEDVEAEAAKFTVAGGQGEINITSEADFSNVEIYSINGSLATVADVQAGATTSVSLPAGIYIVMGQKVQVK